MLSKEANEVIDKIVTIADVLLFIALVFLVGFIIGMGVAS